MGIKDLLFVDKLCDGAGGNQRQIVTSAVSIQKLSKVDASSFNAAWKIAAVSHCVVAGAYSNVLCAPSIYRAAAVGHFFHRPGSCDEPNAFRADLRGSRIRITRPVGFWL
jgi:hypothetical protein